MASLDPTPGCRRRGCSHLVPQHARPGQWARWVKATAGSNSGSRVASVWSARIVNDDLITGGLGGQQAVSTGIGHRRGPPYWPVRRFHPAGGRRRCRCSSALRRARPGRAPWHRRRKGLCRPSRAREGSGAVDAVGPEAPGDAGQRQWHHDPRLSSPDGAADGDLPERTRLVAPGPCRAPTAGCARTGTWPVAARRRGDRGQRALCHDRTPGRRERAEQHPSGQPCGQVRSDVT